MISNVKNAFIMKNQKSKFSVNILPIMNLYSVPIDVYSVGQAHSTLFINLGSLRGSTEFPKS